MKTLDEINIYVANHVSEWGIQEHIQSLKKLFEKNFHVTTSLSIKEGVINIILDEFADDKKTKKLIKAIEVHRQKNSKTKIVLVASEFMGLNIFKNLTINSSKSTRNMSVYKSFSIFEKSAYKFSRSWIELRGFREKRYFKKRARGLSLFMHEVQISLVLSLHPRIQKQFKELFPEQECEYALQLPTMEKFKFDKEQEILLCSLGSTNRYRRKVKEKIAKIAATSGVLVIESNQLEFDLIKLNPRVENIIDVFIPKNINWHLNSPMRFARSSSLNFLPITFSDIQDEFSAYLQLVTCSDIFTDFSREKLVALIAKYNVSVDSYNILYNMENNNIIRKVQRIAGE